MSDNRDSLPASNLKLSGSHGSHMAFGSVRLDGAGIVDGLKFDSDGLIPAIVQDDDNGDVLMMAWMNAHTLRQSLEEGRTVFWSRSRQEVWRKGDTSGDRQFIRSAAYDCDGDALVFRVFQEGRGACHTGERTCFFRSFPVFVQ